VNPLDTSKRDFAGSPVAATRPASALGVRQLLIVALLFGGYAARYFCRPDFSVAIPLLIDELGRHGVGHADALVHIGQIASLGVFAYALGKLFLTGIGLGGASVFTLLFTLGGTVPAGPYSYLGGALAIDFGGKQGTLGLAVISLIAAGGAGHLYRLGARAALKQGRMP